MVSGCGSVVSVRRRLTSCPMRRPAKGVNIRISILPKTTLGWWSVGLVVTSILLFVLSQVILGPGPDYNMLLGYTLTIVLTGVAVGASIAGFTSIIKKKERSILVFVAMAIGLYSLIGGIVSLLGLTK